MKLLVTNSPFNQEQTELLNRLLPTLSETQKVWLNGYLSATAATTINPAVSTAEVPSSAPAPVAAEPVSKDVTILFGSQTGNAQNLAKKSAKTLTDKGFNVTTLSMTDFKPNNIKKLKNLLIIVSTHGEGDPPDTALTFHEFLHGKRAPKLEELNFSVLSLGDSSYEFFCQTGKEFDERLEEIGGKRLFPRVDCDLDFEEPANEWLEGVLSELGNTSSAAGQSPVSQGTAPTVETEYSRSNPFLAEVLDIQNLNGRGSNKETLHIELSLEESGLTYRPGDSLGIYPKNEPELVETLLQELSFNPEETVTINKKGEIRSIKEALLSEFEITVLTKPLLEKLAAYSTNEALQDLLKNQDKLKSYVDGRDLLDLVKEFGPWNLNSQTLVSQLRKLPARLYSIASSYTANPEEVHLTIGAVRYNAHDRERKGVCSILCAERLNPGDKLPVFIQQNENFNLPENPDTPVIMIGPGTGIAPFRSFMQEREESGAEGKSWLFFGDQHFVTDFLYQTEWQNYLKDGVLTKMNVAFSRDTAEKVYVQHRMLEHSKELFEWLQQGAAVYICGDEKHMAHDVHETLISIIEKEGNLNREDAEKYLAAMQQDKRYQRDVY